MGAVGEFLQEPCKDLAWWTPFGDLVNSIGFPGSELLESILPDRGRFEVEFKVQSAIDFEARSIKLFCMLFCEALVLSKVSKLSMAVVSTVVVDPVSELIDSVVIGCEGVGLPMLVVEVALALLVVVEAKLIDLAGINMLMSFVVVDANGELIELFLTNFGFEFLPLMTLCLPAPELDEEENWPK